MPLFFCLGQHRTPSPCLHAHPLREDEGLEQGRTRPAVCDDGQNREPAGHNVEGPTREEGLKVLGILLGHEDLWPHIWSQFWQKTRLFSVASPH